ncbi:MAG: hypothetical protein WAV40_03555 [Microgenomates group bacterium]
MDQTFNHTQIKQIKLAMKQVLVDELGENYQGRLDRIENKVDAACKIGFDNRQELAITESNFAQV